MLRGVIVLLCILSVFKIPLYFAINGLLGYKYEGKEESSIYIIYLLVIFFSSFLVYGASFFKKYSIKKREIILLLFVLLLFINHAIWLIVDRETTFIPENLQFFIVIALPGFFAAKIVNSWNLLNETIKLSQFFFIVIAIGLINSILIPFLAGEFERGIGGASYQAASYYSAFAYGGLGFFCFYPDTSVKSKLLTTTPLLFIQILLMIGLFLSGLINGGSGAFILFVLYSIIFIYWWLKFGFRSINKFFKAIILVILLMVPLVIVLPRIANNNYILNGFARATAFISWDTGPKLDFERGSSGRDHVYLTALNGIKESPIIGYGSFSHWDKVIQPHNIILDIILQFGIPISIILLIFLLMAYKRLIFSKEAFLIILSLYPLINLTFSGGYLRDSLFWFVVTLIVLKPRT